MADIAIEVLSETAGTNAGGAIAHCSDIVAGLTLQTSGGSEAGDAVGDAGEADHAIGGVGAVGTDGADGEAVAIVVEVGGKAG